MTLGAIVNGYYKELKDLNWKEDFTHTYAGRTYTLNIPIKLRPFSWSGSILRIELKKSLSTIYIFMTQPFSMSQETQNQGIQAYEKILILESHHKSMHLPSLRWRS